MPRRRTTRGSTAYRRRTPQLATTLGAALGTFLVAMLTGASWPVRIGLAVLAVAVVGGYLLWSGRRTPDPSPGPDPLCQPSPEPSSDPPPDPKDQR
ncbi:MAG TPA: hypothetical protein VFX53_16810 [Pedococcus sp.]|nr:hypothetical protein [Pedococcus sp.]